MKPILFCLPFLFLIMISCGQADPNKQIDEGKIKDATYESKEIGWSIEIPKDWPITSRDKMEATDKKGMEAIEKATGSKVDTKSLKHLINFQKNQFNVFTSTSERFEEEFPGEYDKNNYMLHELIYNTFTSQGIRSDTLSGKETIQGIEFYTFFTTIYAPDGKVILKQILYNQLINGFDFAVSISYNNEEDKAAMLNAWKNSKFVKP